MPWWCVCNRPHLLVIPYDFSPLTISGNLFQLMAPRWSFLLPWELFLWTWIDHSPPDWSSGCRLSVSECFRFFGSLQPELCFLWFPWRSENSPFPAGWHIHLFQASNIVPTKEPTTGSGWFKSQALAAPCQVLISWSPSWKCAVRAWPLWKCRFLFEPPLLRDVNYLCLSCFDSNPGSSDLGPLPWDAFFTAGSGGNPMMYINSSGRGATRKSIF